MPDTLVIDPSGDNIIVPCQRAGKAQKRSVGDISTSYSGSRRSHKRAELDVLPVVFVNCTPALCRQIEAKFALGAQVECAGTVFNRDDDGTTVVLCDGEYTDDMEQGGGWRVPGLTLYEVAPVAMMGLGGQPASVSPDDEVVASALFAHYDAQALTGVADGADLLLWPDEGPNGYDAPANAPSYPGNYQANAMNGFPGVYFDPLGNNQRGYGLPAIFDPDTGEGEAFIVLRAPSTGGGPWWGMGTTAIGAGPSMPTGSGGTLYDCFGSAVQRSITPIGIDPQAPWLYHVQARNGLWKAWINGVLRYSTTTNTATWDGSYFGMWLQAGAFYIPGTFWIGELILRNGFLDADAAATQESDLLTKWGIA